MRQPLFPLMTSEQRDEWLECFQHYLMVEQPEIAAAKALTDEIRGYFDNGLNLIEPFTFARSFVDETRRFGDYLRRRAALARFVKKAQTDAEKYFPGKRVDITDPELLKKHVGAPTADEKKARELAKEAENLAKAKAEKNVQQGLFESEESDESGDNHSPSHSLTLSPSDRLHLDQVKWLLSDGLKADIDTIRDLRQKASAASTAAKQMALDGKSEAEIAVYAKEAAECTEAYEHIYQQVDDELAIVFVRMKEDEQFVKQLNQQGINIKEWRTLLRPYYDKVEDKELLLQNVLNMIAENDPEQIARREADAKRKKEVADIVKNLKRKDQKPSENRLKTMKERYARLVELIGEDDAKAYLPLIDAVEKAINPESNS